MTSRLLLSAAALLLFAACNSTPVESYWGMRAAVPVIDEIDADVDGTEAAVSYDAIQGTLYLRRQTLDGLPLMNYEVNFAVSEFQDLEANEVGAGVRYYIAPSQHFRPFAGLAAKITMLEETAGVDRGTHIGLLPAIGVEVPITDMFFFDLMVDYSVPLSAAESDDSPVQETEFSGFAVWLGFGLDF